jgi:hypothetical protein
VSVAAEAPPVYECFSEAPLVPRRLSFYESQASHEVVNGLSRPEAPSELVAALAKAFVAMVGRRATGAADAGDESQGRPA